MSGARPAGYATVDAATRADLAGIVGAANVLTAAGDLEAYARDATPLFHHRPDAVVLVRTAREVAGVLRLATARRIPVVPRGGGSNLAAMTVPVHGGIVLSLARMNRIKEISVDELLAVVEPGVTTAELALAAGRHNLLFAPDPGSKTVSTVGGNVATCAGGLRGLKYGVTRNYVLGAEVVLPTGEVIRTGGRLWKDVAGYDLTRLLTGSEGTLGVLTELTMALLPSPATSTTGVAYFDDLSVAGDAVAAILRGGLVPATLEFLDRRCVNAVEDATGMGLDRDAGALLLFGDDGHPESVERSVTAMARTCESYGASGITVAGDVAQADDLLAARRCSLPALARIAPVTMLEDVTVPRPHLARMVRRITETADRHEVVCATFGHAGDGNLHPTMCVDPARDGQVERAHRAFGEIFTAAMELGGTITGEHGVGAAKLPYLTRRLGSDQVALLRRIKKAFDPAGILNPGKLGS